MSEHEKQAVLETADIYKELPLTCAARSMATQRQ